MYQKLRQRVLKANLDLYRSQLALLTWGNVSERATNGNYFAIKPSGVAYEAMTIDDIVVLDFSGKVLAGNRKPSSDTPTHAVLYQTFPQLRGIVHTHSPYGVAWAQTGRDIPCFGTTHADHFYGPIPCARALTKFEVTNNYEQATGLVLANEFQQRGLKPDHMPAMLVKFHGPFTFSTKSGHDAVKIAQILEEVAKMAFLTRQIDPQARVIDPFLKTKHYKRKHGANAYYGQNKD